jgi:hypothetical protein
MIHIESTGSRLTIAASLILALAAIPEPEQPQPAAAQSVLTDIHGLSPRQIKVDAFSLDTPQDVRIEAVGEPGGDSRAYAWLQAIWSGDKVNRNEREADPWVGDAWILDLQSRRVVWELSASTTGAGARGTRQFAGTLRLPAGAYAGYVSAFPHGMYSSDEGIGQKLWRSLGADGLGDYKLVIRGSGRRFPVEEVDRLRQRAAATAIVSFRGLSREQFHQTGFTLEQPATVEIYAVGEARQDGEFDYGWIINADTRERIWKLTWRDSVAAGGATKNRMVRETRSLPAGRYAAFYATDDSHDQSEWNSPPPRDPDFWGLTITVREAGARAAARTFGYELVPQSGTFLALTRVGNRESKVQGFTLTKPLDVRVYAIGEGRSGRMFDYGWITSADTRRRVWEMRFADTEHAGGDTKNRLVDTTVHLNPGAYVVHYISDDSHASGDWNAAAPADSRHWGITLLAAKGALDRSAIGPYVERDNPAIVADLTGVRDDDHKQKRFTLGRETSLRVYALGEGTRSGMVDYGWIEDAKTGKTVWEMTYRTTEPAGGASKNRRVDTTITLPAGEYVVKYEADGSHSFADWNADPPDDPEAWGITVFRANR